MQYDTITPLITRFNNVVDSLTEDFKDKNLDAETVIFLAKKTRNFIGFTELALLNVIFAILDKMNNTNYKFDSEISDAKLIINNIFENMNKALDTILAHDHDEEEYLHGHNHNHEHHYDFDVDEIRGDINQILENLASLKKIIGDIAEIVISTIKYEADEIKEDVFKKEYANFKENIERLKKESEKTTQ